MRSKIAILVAILSLSAAVALVGCGGSSGAATSGPTETSQVEASAKFLKDKEGKKYARFGKESSATTREEASEVLSRNLEARETGDFRAQCETLDSGSVTSYAGYSTLHGEAAIKACAKRLKEVARPTAISAETQPDLLDGSIDALRVKGNDAYALFRGTDGKDHAEAMKREAGGWKVTSLLLIELD